MLLEELLIKIGVDATQVAKIDAVIGKLTHGAQSINDKANSIAHSVDSTINDVNSSVNDLSASTDRASNSLDEVSSHSEKASFGISKVKIAIAAVSAAFTYFGFQVASAFNTALASVGELRESQYALYDITNDQIIQAGAYQKALERSRIVIDSVKTKIALDLAPAITDAVNGFSDWIATNKDLIVNGLEKAIKVIGKVVSVIGNTIKFINQVVTGTVGWKAVIIALTAAFVVLNSTMLLNPITWIIAGIVGLMLLIDDLMTYMRGGQSLFGDYWQPLIDGAKMLWGVVKGAIDNFVNLFNFFSAIFSGNADDINRTWTKLWKGVVSYFKKMVDFITSIFKGAIKGILKLFGMTDEKAQAVVDAIGNSFSLIWDLITTPFKLAAKAIFAIFDVVWDGAISAVNNIGAGFYAVYDLIVKPFKLAKQWIIDKFNGFIEKTLSSIRKVASLVGIDLDFSVSSDDESESEDASALRQAFQGISKESIRNAGNASAVAQNAITNSTQNKTVNLTVNNDTKINTSDTRVGAEQAGDMVNRQIENAVKNNASAIGVN